MTDQPQPAGWLRWRQLLKLGEQLMAAPTIAAQCDLILATAADLFSAQADIWLAEAFQRLPVLEAQSPFPPSPPSELMCSALNAQCTIQGRTALGEASASAVAVPLLVNEMPLGVLQLEREVGPPFNEVELELLNGLALQSAISLQAALQVEIERWHVEQLALVRQVSAQVANVLDLDELFRRVADLILDTFKYYYVALFTLEPDGENLRFRASAGPIRAPTNGERQRGAVLHPQAGEGIIGHVARDGVEILANDVSREPRYRYEDALPETQSEVALPLKIENRVVGVLDVQSDKPGDFHETDMLVLRALAANISMSVESARLYGNLHRRADQLAAIAEVSRAVASILDLDALFDEVVTLIHQRFGYPFVHLFTVHPGRRQVAYQAGSGRRSRVLREQGLAYSLDAPQGIIPWVARHGKTMLANDVEGDPLYRPSRLPPRDTRAELAVPLVFGSEVLGVLDIQSDRRNAFGEDDRFLFEALADNVAVAIRNASLYRSEKWRRQVADSLREAAGLLAANLALNQALDAILTELERTLPCDVAAIWLLHDGDPSAPSGRTFSASRMAAESGAVRPGRAVSEAHVHLAAIHGCAADEVVACVDELSSEVTLWLDQALYADQPTIRTSQSPVEPVGAALGLPAEYSAIAAPLRVGDRRLGLLALIHHEPDRYGVESQAMTSAFASYAAVAIENTRLYEAAQEQAWISTVLLQVAEATRSLTSLDEVLETVVRLMPLLVGARRCALLFAAEEGRRRDQSAELFAPAVAYGFSSTQQAFFEQWRVRAGDVPALDHLCLIKKPIVIQHAAQDPRLPANLAAALGFESLLILPLLTRGEVLGAMLLDNQAGWPGLQEEWLAMMLGIAHQTATAIENARLLEARQQEAYVSAALLQVAQAIVSLNELDDILRAIVRIMPMLVGVEWCVIFVWDEQQGAFRPAQMYGITPGGQNGPDQALWLTRRYAPGDFPLLDALRDSDELIAVDAFSSWKDLVPLGFASDFVAYLCSAREVPADQSAESGAPRALLALPLSVKGEVLGVMLVEESVPLGPYRERRLEIITSIAQQAALAIQNDLLQREMAEREHLERELQLAHDIQQAFLPTQAPQLTGWELAFSWQAARQVAGDFYDFFELPDRRMGLVIGDVADKGMPAALFMTLARTLVRAEALEAESPAAVLARVNDLLVANTQQGMFVTIAYAILSLETGQLAYASAGHPPPLVWRLRSRKLEPLEKRGMALGVLEGIHQEEHTVWLEPGDHVVFYTDGITEAFSPQGGIYGDERLAETIQGAGSGSAQDLLAVINESVIAFMGDQPCSDDMTLMVVHRSN